MSEDLVQRVIIPDLIKKKEKKEKIVALTAYDFPSAKIVDHAGVDIILVGDSLGMVLLGYVDTIPVSMDEMIHHTKAVVRAVKRSIVVGDMPYMSFQISIQKAVENASRFIKEAGARAKEYIEKNFGKEYVPKHPVLFKKSGQKTQDAHEAIRPTSVQLSPESIRKNLSPEQFKLYELIWKRFLQSQMAPAMRFIAYLSPLTYAQDLMYHAVVGKGLIHPVIDVVVLGLSAVLDCKIVKMIS